MNERVGDGRCERGADTRLGVNDGARAHGHAEDLGHRLGRRTLAQALLARELPDHGIDARAKAERRHASRQRPDGDVSAAAAATSVLATFVEHRHDRRQVDDLMTMRRGVVVELVTAAALALARDGFGQVTSLLGRQQGALALGVAGLPTGLAAGLLLGGSRGLGTRAVGRRGLGRVGRVLPQLLFQLGDAHSLLFDDDHQLGDPRQGGRQVGDRIGKAHTISSRPARVALSSSVLERPGERVQDAEPVVLLKRQFNIAHPIMRTVVLAIVVGQARSLPIVSVDVQVVDHARILLPKEAHVGSVVTT